ncbi:MAG: DNA polymerase domain-containing protein [Candidatus Bathyarchaeota archaeon]
MDFYYLIDIKVEEGIPTLRFFHTPTRKIVEIKDIKYKPHFYLHHPLTETEKENIQGLNGECEEVQKRDLYSDNIKTLNKVTLNNPENIRKVPGLFDPVWENEVKYPNSYAYDHNLVFGAAHKIKANTPILVKNITQELENKFEQAYADTKLTDPLKYDQIKHWFKLIHQPIPKINLDKLVIKKTGTANIHQAFTLARIANLPVTQAYGSRRVSDWLRSIIHNYLRKNNILIPTSKELRRGLQTHRVPGALTLHPKKGIYYNTVVCDFESLYPSCIDSYNLSYETVNCSHKQCRSKTIDECQDHWVCIEKRGFYSILVGALKDLRIHWFKPLSKADAVAKLERENSQTLSRLLKLMTVSSYGVTVRIHGLACPPLAECITGYGRWALKRTWSMAESRGLRPIYGDTDSIFLDGPSSTQVEWLIKTVKEKLLLDLAIERRYSLCVLPEAKKAYFGIQSKGEPDIKGLTAIKSNSPTFIQKVFRDCIKELRHVSNHEEFKAAKQKILEIVQKASHQLKSRKINLGDLTYSVRLYFDPKKRLETKAKSKPQPYQCAIQLMDTGKKVEKGDTVHFIKVRPFNYKGSTFTVKPKTHVKDVMEVNVTDYVRNMKTALGQTFAPMRIELKSERKISEWF